MGVVASSVLVGDVWGVETRGVLVIVRRLQCKFDCHGKFKGMCVVFEMFAKHFGAFSSFALPSAPPTCIRPRHRSRKRPSSEVWGRLAAFAKALRVTHQSIFDPQPQQHGDSRFRGAHGQTHDNVGRTGRIRTSLIAF